MNSRPYVPVDVDILPCGHYYLEEFKWETFAALREYFGRVKRDRGDAKWKT